jgi:HSP90 family molecular chaperone
MDKCKELIPEYLNFMKRIVGSDGLFSQSLLNSFHRTASLN